MSPTPGRLDVTRGVLAIDFQFLGYSCKLIKDLLQRWPSNWLANVQVVSDLKIIIIIIIIKLSPNEHVHARFHTIFDIAFFREGTQCNDRSGVAHLTNEAGALKAIKIWHLENYLVPEG